MKIPYEFNLYSPSGLIDVSIINGCMQAMTAIARHITELTKYSPENRMIDSVVILETLIVTYTELNKILDETFNK